MTGFGTAEGTAGGGRIQFDIKTVNHRHFSAQLKFPNHLQVLEANLRDCLRQVIDRGHVTVAARWIDEPSVEPELQVNVPRAQRVVQALSELKEELGIKGKIDISLVARLPEVLVSSPRDVPTVEWSEVEEVVRAALAGVLESRAREGLVLEHELRGRLVSIRRLVDAVETRAPERVTRERERLQAAVAELTNGRAVDEARLAQEVAILADRLDVTEELVRLRSHLTVAQEALDAQEPVGKRLAFLGQELLREINTIGSKANDATIAHLVIDMKGELEKFREQVENIE
jgi:uncharacterized protein (TIGR00255 family)